MAHTCWQTKTPRSGRVDKTGTIQHGTLPVVCTGMEKIRVKKETNNRVHMKEGCFKLFSRLRCCFSYHRTNVGLNIHHTQTHARTHAAIAPLVAPIRMNVQRTSCQCVLRFGFHSGLGWNGNGRE